MVFYKKKKALRGFEHRLTYPATPVKFHEDGVKVISVLCFPGERPPPLHALAGCYQKPDQRELCPHQGSVSPVRPKGMGVEISPVHVVP